MACKSSGIATPKSPVNSSHPHVFFLPPVVPYDRSPKISSSVTDLSPKIRLTTAGGCETVLSFQSPTIDKLTQSTPINKTLEAVSDLALRLDMATLPKEDTL